jgi:hypothetical protein
LPEGRTRRGGQLKVLWVRSSIAACTLFEVSRCCRGVWAGWWCGWRRINENKQVVAVKLVMTLDSELRVSSLTSSS